MTRRTSEIVMMLLVPLLVVSGCSQKVPHRTGNGAHRCVMIDMSACAAPLARGGNVPGAGGYGFRPPMMEWAGQWPPID
jgi:hypothetical protein